MKDNSGCGFSQTNFGPNWYNAFDFGSFKLNIGPPKLNIGPPVVKVKLCNSTALLPEKATPEAAAFDIFSPTPLWLIPGINVIDTGIILEIPKGYKGEIYSRSGLAANGVWVANQPGKIDSDYTGLLRVILYNSNPYTVRIEKWRAIAQLEINPVNGVVMLGVQEITKQTERGDKGLGSTDNIPPPLSEEESLKREIITLKRVLKTVYNSLNSRNELDSSWYDEVQKILDLNNPNIGNCKSSKSK